MALASRPSARRPTTCIPGSSRQLRKNRIGLPQAPLGVTRFRVTFTQPGIFDYKCSLHDALGMVRQIIVVP